MLNYLFAEFFQVSVGRTETDPKQQWTHVIPQWWSHDTQHHLHHRHHHTSCSSSDLNHCSLQLHNSESSSHSVNEVWGQWAACLQTKASFWENCRLSSLELELSVTVYTASVPFSNISNNQGKDSNKLPSFHFRTGMNLASPGANPGPETRCTWLLTFSCTIYGPTKQVNIKLKLTWL